MDYSSIVQAWLDAHSVTVKIELFATGHAPWDHTGSPHDQYKVTLARGTRSYGYVWYDSIVNTANRAPKIDTYDVAAWRKRRSLYRTPDAYAVLSPLQWYEPPNTLQGFIDEYGSSGNADRDLALWRACVEEFNGLARLFTEPERMELAEVSA